MYTYIKDYPRPQMVRNSWTNLNGAWKFQFDDSSKGETEKWYETFPAQPLEIQVPFTYETKLSGIEDQGHHSQVWYEKTVTVTEEELAGKKVLIHFEGSDFLTKVWINGIYVGEHKGGYARFSFDITRYLTAGENRVTVKADDTCSIEQPRGKQRWIKENFGCWYVQTTGIWKTVWMEIVPETYLTAMKVTPNVEDKSIAVEYEVNEFAEGSDLQIETEIHFGEMLINRSVRTAIRKKVSDTISVFCPDLPISGVRVWSIKNPNLYDMKIRIRKDGKVVDEIDSYFGLRDVRIEKGNILLNGSPIYQRLILDQGYWEESHLTPPSEEALIDDIDKIRAMGYNGVRKHMKVEDERFLYWCDKKGMLVWSEMAAAYEFSDNAVEEFTREWMEIVRQNYNHPSIITWTPFNESWGVPDIKTNKMQQHFTESIYYLTKSMDAMRPVIVNDGWDHTISDIITLHDYEEDGDIFFERYFNNLEKLMSSEIYHCKDKSSLAEGYEYKGQPIIISEFGGIAFSGGGKGDWGYGHTVANKEEFMKRFDKITTAIKKLPYVVGYCYTQVSDVQQEINGLLDKNHEYKLPADELKEINCREVLPTRRIGD